MCCAVYFLPRCVQRPSSSSSCSALCSRWTPAPKQRHPRTARPADDFTCTRAGGGGIAASSSPSLPPSLPAEPDHNAFPLSEVSLVLSAAAAAIAAATTTAAAAVVTTAAAARRPFRASRYMKAIYTFIKGAADGRTEAGRKRYFHRRTTVGGFVWPRGPGHYRSITFRMHFFTLCIIS